MALRNFAALGLLSLLVFGCKGKSPEGAESKDLHIVKARSGSAAPNELVVYYANETEYQPNGLHNNIQMMNSYLQIFKQDRKNQDLAEKLTQDMTVFPGTVSKEVADLERLICTQAESSSVKGLLVITNKDAFRGTYRYCAPGSGGKLETKAFILDIPREVHGTPLSDPGNFAKITTLAAEIAKKTENTGLTLIIKSHGSKKSPLISCHPTYLDAVGFSLTDSTKGDLGTEAEVGLGTDEQSTLGIDGAPELEISMSDSEHDVHSYQPIEDMRRQTRVRMKVTCGNPSTSFDQLYRTLLDTEKQVPLNTVFMESCYSGMFVPIQAPKAEIWGSDINGLKYNTIPSYSSFSLNTHNLESNVPAFSRELSRALTETCMKGVGGKMNACGMINK